MKTFLPSLIKSNSVNKLLLTILFMFFACSINAQRFAVTTGNWNGSIWATTAGGVAGSAAIPTAADAVTINASVVVTVNVAANAASLTVNGELDVTGANLTIANGGSVTANSGSSTVFNSSNVINGGGNASNGIVVTINSGASLTTANASGFVAGVNNSVLGGSFAINRGNRGGPTYSAGANYTYDGGTQNTGTGLPTNLTGTLTINSSATVTLSAAETIASGGTVTLTAGTFSAGTNLTMASTSTINRSGGDITGTLQGTGQYNVNYTGSSKTTGIELAVSGTSAQGLNNLTVNLTSGQTLTLDANRTPDGNLNISSGNFDLSTFTINRSAAGGTLTLASGSTLKIGSTNPFPTNYSTHSIGATSSIEYAGSNQTINALNSSQNYGNLIFSGSGTKTLGAALTITNNLSISSGVVANLSTFTNTAGTLTLGGFGAPSGSHGSTTSSATYKNNTYFAATTGIINVSTGTCSAISAVLSGTNTICSGASSNLVVTVTGGASTYTVVYSGGTVNTYTSGSNISVSPSSTTGYTLTSVTDFNGCTASVSGTPTVTVRPVFTSGAIDTTGETICYNGDPANISSTTAASGGDNTITYKWQANGVDIPSSNSASYDPPTGLTTTTTYTRYAKDGTCNTTFTISTGSWVVTVRPNFTSGAINTTGETICYNGDPTAIGSATAASGGDNTITYKWQANGVDIPSSNSASYDPPSGLTTTTTYTRYAKDGTCNTTFTLSTGSWVVTVNPNFTSGAINTTGETICNGGTPASTIGSTTSASGGDGSITYSWRSSADGYTAAISGATSATYLPPSGLTTTTSYRRYANDGTCNTTPTVSTGTWTVTVYSTFTTGAIDTTGETICNGGTPASTIGSTTAASGGDGSITYSWRSSADGYTAAISGATSATYLPPSGLTSTTSYRRYANDSTCNTTPTVSTGTWTVTVNATFTTGAIDTTGETICNGGTPASTIGSTTAASGGDGSITYSWRSSSDGYTAAISGATSATYLPPSGLTTTTSYRRYANDGTCNTTPTVSSGTWTVTVYAAFTSGAINTTGETICSGGTPATTIGSTTAASGGDGSITYSWRSSADGYTAAISGATSATYLPPSGLTTTTSYRRYANDGTCNTTPTVSSGTWTVTVDATSVGGTVASDQTICYGTEPGDLTLSGYTGTIVKWQSSSDVGFSSPIDIVETSATLAGTTIGSLTANTYFRAVVQSGVCSVAYSASVLITVDALTVGGSVSADQTICSGSQPADLTLSGHTGSVIKWETSLDSSFSSPTDIFITSTTLTGATIGALTQDTYFRAVVQNGTCDVEESSYVLITVNDPSVGGSVAGGTAICAGSTSGLLTLSGHTGSVVRWEYSVSPFTSWTTITNTTTTYTSGALTQTTQFRAVVQNGACAEANSTSTSVDINSTTWTSGAWSNSAPTSTTAAIISDTYTSGGTNINACSLTVDSGASVVISSGDTVTLSGPITVVSGSVVTFNNNANLIQSGSSNSNSGALIIKRNSSALKRLDYTLWSSPVTGSQTLLAFSPQTSNISPTNIRFYTYNTFTNLYDIAPPASTTFATTKGYLIRMPNNHPTTATIWPGQFTGVPNNGDYSYTLDNGGAGQRFNLVGNPYPSPISAVSFVGDSNNSSSITGTLYFWRKTNNALSPTYCTWTTGGFVSNGEAQVFDPNDVIQTGQGFFVEGTGSGTVNFHNSMRVNDHANQFFKTASNTTSSTTTIEKNRIWLNAINSTGSFSQAMVGYITNATQDVDPTIDGKYINDGDIALTSMIGTTRYAIQGRALPFDANDIVPLNLKVTTAGDYTIAIDHVDGLFSGGSQSIYLRDNDTGTIQDLNNGGYTFASTAGTFDSRFDIIYQLPLGYHTPTFNENQVVIYENQSGEFVINTSNVNMAFVKVFDIRGRLLETKTNINSNQTTVNTGLANEVLLVQITSEEGITVTKKVIK